MSRLEQADGRPSQQAQDKINIDMEAIRQKLVAQVEKHPFWSNKAAKRMQLTLVENRRIYIHELVSFCERRDLEWCYEPYKGGLVPSIPFRLLDSPSAGAQTTPVVSQSASYFMASPNLPSQMQRQQVPCPTATPSNDLGEHTRLTSPGSRSLWSHHSESLAGNESDSALGASSRLSPASRVKVKGRGLYEPVSAIEHPVPDSDSVWAIEPPAHVKPEPFSGYAHSSEFPNSSFVKMCHGCGGRGRIKCASCYGAGYEVCLSCSGKGTTRSSGVGSGALSSRSSGRGGDSSRNSTYANGYDYEQDSDGRGRYGEQAASAGSSSGLGSSATGSAWVTESCHFCHGAGQKRCWVCAGKSYNHCLGCAGAGKLRCYLTINITWLNHRDEIILNNSDNIIPRDRLRLCSGLLLADETDDQLRPLNKQHIDGATGRVEETNQLHAASRKLLDKHYRAYKGERLIKQNQRLTQIQCHVVGYEWKRRRGQFVIYGNEKKVYIAKYPFKSICSIT